MLRQDFFTGDLIEANVRGVIYDSDEVESYAFAQVFSGDHFIVLGTSTWRDEIYVLSRFGAGYVSKRIVQRKLG